MKCPKCGSYEVSCWVGEDVGKCKCGNKVPYNNPDKLVVMPFSDDTVCTLGIKDGSQYCFEHGFGGDESMDFVVKDNNGNVAMKFRAEWEGGWRFTFDVPPNSVIKHTNEVIEDD